MRGDWMDEARKFEGIDKAALRAIRAELRCDGADGCAATVTHIDNKGFIYCTGHGEARRSWLPCRKMRAWEVAKLRAGETISYTPKPRPKADQAVRS